MSENSQNKTIADFVTLKCRVGLVHTILAASKLGVFEALSAGQLTADQIAEKIDADPQRVAALMNVVAGSELIEQYGDQFALSMLSRLIPSQYFDFEHWNWENIVQHVRSGEPNEKGIVVEDNPDADYLLQQAAEEWMLTPAALVVAQILDIGNSRQGLSILELGCGSAVFSATLAHADPSAKLTLVDTTVEIARAKTTCQSVQILDRTTLIEAENWRDVEVIDLLGTPDSDDTTMVPQPTFDLVLVHKKIHLDGLNRIAGLMKKLGALLLNRGGELAIVDVFPGQQPGTEYHAIHELEFGLRHSHGRCHHPRDLEPALKAAGFDNVQFAHLPAEPFLYGLVLAAKG